MLSENRKLWLAKSFFVMITRSPDCIGTIISIFLVIMLYMILKKRRKIIKQRLSRYGLNTNLSKKIAYRLGRNLALMSKPRTVIVKSNEDLAGKIGISIHFGAWELIGYGLAKLGYRFGVITRRYEGNLHQLIKRYRSKLGIKTFYPDQLLRIKDFLQKGGTVGMMVDGHTPQSRLPQAKRLAQLFKVEISKGIILPHNGRLILVNGNIDFNSFITNYPEHYAWYYIPNR